jgi:hypothetical protein
MGLANRRQVSMSPRMKAAFARSTRSTSPLSASEPLGADREGASAAARAANGVRKPTANASRREIALKAFEPST